MASSTQKSPTMHQRLAALRSELKKIRLDAFIVPRQDEFQGEYVAAYAERLKWISGFSGSWGTAVIGQKTAAIFVDGRYTVQVRNETDSKSFQFHHLVTSPPAEWIAATFRKASRIGHDPKLLSVADARRYAAACEKAKLKFVAVSRNPIDSIWKEQPARPCSPIVEHPKKFAGATVSEKLQVLRSALKEKHADAAILADPTSVAWAFNVRGHDVPFTPVPLAYAIVTLHGKCQIFLEGKRLSPPLRKQLGKHVSFAGAGIGAALAALGRRKAKVLLDPVAAPDHIRLALERAGASIVESPDPCLLAKATKNKAEQQGARAAHATDAVAMAHFLAWLDNHNAPESLSESEAADRLAAFRRDGKNFKDLSFESISAAAANSALPHYHAKGRGAHLKRDGIYLIDSGGQYLDGTTDITRTVIIGKPSEEMRERFTFVLKGMIAITLLRFPQGTIGAQIDALARAALWKAGLDFDHGTGHGVGSYLSVHEGPARISKSGNHALEPGMILSNEPGYYKAGHYGIRTENLLLVTPPARIPGGDKLMLGFETLTFVPIDRRLIQEKLLTREEVHWLDGYHAKVHALLSPEVSGEARTWLDGACAPLN